METSQVPARIKELEDTIFNAIKEFEKETNLQVIYITLKDKVLPDFYTITDGVTITVSFKRSL